LTCLLNLAFARWQAAPQNCPLGPDPITRPHKRHVALLILLCYQTAFRRYDGSGALTVPLASLVKRGGYDSSVPHP